MNQRRGLERVATKDPGRAGGGRGGAEVDAPTVDLLARPGPGQNGHGMQWYGTGWLRIRILAIRATVCASWPGRYGFHYNSIAALLQTSVGQSADSI